MSDDVNRNPLSEVASKAGVLWGTATGVVSALVSYGVWSAAQGDAVVAAGEALSPTINALGVIVAGVMPIVAGVVAAFRTSSVGKDKVTPLVDPRDNAGNALMALGRHSSGE